MLKVELIKVENSPEPTIEFYNGISRIPFTVSLGNRNTPQESIYTRNINGGNFIEFWFDKYSYDLYEIDLISIQNTAIVTTKISPLLKEESLYTCKIIPEKSLLEDSLPIEIVRDRNSICVNIINTKSDEINYFCIAKNIHIGVNADSYLTSLLVKDLTEENMHAIFGF